MGVSGRLLPEWVVRWGGSTVYQGVLGFPHFSGEVSIVQTGSYISAGTNYNAPLSVGRAQPRAACDRCTVIFPTLGIMLKHRAHCNGKLSVDKPLIRTTTIEPTVSITRRLTETESARSFVRTNCDRAFAYPQRPGIHLQVHTDEKVFACGQCEKSYASLRSLRNHERSHKAKSSYSCPYCDKRFKKAGHRWFHLAAHTNTSPFDCLFCPEKFKRFAPLSMHLQEKHAGQKAKAIFQRNKSGKDAFACPQCHKTFSTPHSLKTHMLAHSGETPHECTHCSRKYRTQQQLATHMSIHLGVKPYPCFWCDRQYSRADSWRIHLHTHNVVKPFLCENCKAQFATLRQLTLHQNRQRQCLFSCPYCKKKSGNKFLMKIHIETHDK